MKWKQTFYVRWIIQHLGAHYQFHGSELHTDQDKEHNTYMLINHNSVHRFDHSLTVVFRYYYCLPKNQRLADPRKESSVIIVTGNIDLSPEEDEDPACVVTVGFNLLREEPRACWWLAQNSLVLAGACASLALLGQCLLRLLLNQLSTCMSSPQPGSSPRSRMKKVHGRRDLKYLLEHRCTELANHVPALTWRESCQQGPGSS